MQQHLLIENYSPCRMGSWRLSPAKDLTDICEVKSGTRTAKLPSPGDGESHYSLGDRWILITACRKLLKWPVVTSFLSKWKLNHLQSRDTYGTKIHSGFYWRGESQRFWKQRLQTLIIHVLPRHVCAVLKRHRSEAGAAAPAVPRKSREHNCTTRKVSAQKEGSGETLEELH